MISNKKKKFSLSGNSIYLNGAYMSPLLKEVEKAGTEGMKRKRNPGNLSAEDFFTATHQLRDEFAKLINSKETSRIVTVPSASYGLANAAKNIKIDNSQNVIVAAEQF